MFNPISRNDYIPRPAPGVYIAKIKHVEDNEDKQYLKLKVDIAEGPFKDFAAKCEARYGNDYSYLTSYKSYKLTARYYFKKFLDVLVASNSGDFSIEDLDDSKDPSLLEGLKIGIIVGTEEYRKNNGSIGTRLRISDFITIDDVLYGNNNIPAPKLLGG